MYDTICYPVDGSEGSKAPLEDVRTLAARFDAVVHVLHVVDDRPEAFGMVGRPDRVGGPGMSGGVADEENPGMGTGMPDLEELRERLDAQGSTVVTEIAEALSGVETVTTVERGAPHVRITEYADEVGADVIVMGTHGRSGVERLLLGSVTEKVVRTADVPVLTVRRSRNGA